MLETLATLFNNPPRREVVEAPVQVVPVQAPAYDSWAHYFQQHPEIRTNWQTRPRPLLSTAPLQVRPRPRPFTPHPELEVVDVSSNSSNSGDQEMEEMSRGDTVPNTPEHPTTPLEQMEEDDMRRIHPILPSNAALDAAGDNGIPLTNEQHRALTSQSEGSTILYRPRENRHQVEGDDPRLDISDEERGALTAAHDALQFAAGIARTNASPGKNNGLSSARGSAHIAGICRRARTMARSGPVSRRGILGKVNVFTVYTMNKQGELYIQKLLTETLLYRTITMDYYGYYCLLY